MMCICGGAGKIYAEREILLCFDERFPTGVIHTGFPYRQETLLQNVLTLVHYHLVLCEGNKKSLSAGKPTGFWREGKLLSRKSKVKMIRINAPPFSAQQLAFLSSWGFESGNPPPCSWLTVGQLMYLLYHLFSKLQAFFKIIFYKQILKSCYTNTFFNYFT